MLIRILHNFAVFVAKHFWVFISHTIYRNKLIDMIINNITAVINKNSNLFFFPSDIKLAWKAKQKQQELTKNQLFFISLFFSQKFRIKGNQKHKFLKGDSIKRFWVKCWYFSNRPSGVCLTYIVSVKTRYIVQLTGLHCRWYNALKSDPHV